MQDDFHSEVESRRSIVSRTAAIIALAFLARLIILILIDIVSNHLGKNGLAPAQIGGDDGEYYYKVATAIASGAAPPLPIVNGYPFVLGKLMFFTGIESVLFYKILNCLAGCAAIWMCIKIFNLLVKQQGIQRPLQSKMKAISELAIIAGIYPSAIFCETYSLWRDAWIYLFHIAAIYYSLKLFYSRRFTWKALYAIVVPVLMLMLTSLRWYAMLSLLLGLLIWLGLRCFAAFKSEKRAIITAAGFMVIFVGALILAQVMGLAPGAARFNTLSEYRSGTEAMQGGSSLGIDLATASPTAFPVLYAYSLVSNIIGPLPWQLSGATTVGALLFEVPLLLFVLIRLVRRIRYMDLAALYLVSQAIAWFLLIAFFNDNLGTATRLRVLGWHCIFIVYAYLLYKTPYSKSLQKEDSSHTA